MAMSERMVRMQERECKIQLNQKRRIHQIRIQIAVIGCSICLALSLAILYGSVSAKAQANEYLTSYKYFTSIEIKAGDTLWDIASENMDNQHYHSIQEYINEVIRINNLQDSDDIIIGDYLIIPYFSYELML